MKKLVLMAALIMLTNSVFGQQYNINEFQNKDGLYYKFENRTEKQKVMENDLIIGTFSIMFNDSLFYDGSNMNTQPLVMVNEESHLFKGDLIDGLKIMKLGEKCTFAFPKDSIMKLFGPNAPAYFTDGYAFWTIEIDSIVTAEQMAQQQAVQQHFADSLKNAEQGHIQTGLKLWQLNNQLENGIYFRKLVSNDKETYYPQNGDKVKLNYIGKFIDGTLFDTSIKEEAESASLLQVGRTYEPIEFELGRGMMIPGFEAGTQKLKTGERALILLPSNMAYGDRGQGALIPPYTPLVFEIEVVSIEKAQTSPNTPSVIEPIKMNTEPKTK